MNWDVNGIIVDNNGQYLILLKQPQKYIKVGHLESIWGKHHNYDIQTTHISFNPFASCKLVMLNDTIMHGTNYGVYDLRGRDQVFFYNLNW